MGEVGASISVGIRLRDAGGGLRKGADWVFAIDNQNQPTAGWRALRFLFVGGLAFFAEPFAISAFCFSSDPT